MGLGGELVAVWEVPLSDGLHKVGFEHGTTTGRRVLWVDGKEKVHHDWMFKLVGSEVFSIGNTKCVIKIEPVGGFSYEYSLEVQGEFVDDGTETHFDLSGHPAYIRAVSSGNRREGLIHSLVVDDVEIPEAVE
ncbi:hypothetical protein O3P69_002889 [Scylla paramamosain]|uniref:Fas apoptotic inhibitory molecule 1 n=1 Tax=Scylla paramamosain TaxID=85552 RepID=A0AAW0UQZ5_SCYPA